MSMKRTFLILLIISTFILLLFYENHSMDLHTNNQSIFTNITTLDLTKFIHLKVINKGISLINDECEELFLSFNFICIVIFEKQQFAYCSIYLSSCPPPYGIGNTLVSQEKEDIIIRFKDSYNSMTVDSKKILVYGGHTQKTSMKSICEFFCPNLLDYHCHYYSPSRYYFFDFSSLKYFNPPDRHTISCDYYFVHLNDFPLGNALSPYFFAIGYALLNKLNLCVNFNNKHHKLLYNLQTYFPFRTQYKYDLTESISSTYRRSSACHCQEHLYPHECLSGWIEIVDLIPEIVQRGISNYLKEDTDIVQDTINMSRIGVVHSRCAWETVYDHDLFGPASFSLYDQIIHHSEEIDGIVFLDGQRGQIWLCELIRLAIFRQLKTKSKNPKLKRVFIDPKHKNTFIEIDYKNLEESADYILSSKKSSSSKLSSNKYINNIIISKFIQDFSILYDTWREINFPRNEVDYVLADFIRIIEAPVVFRTAGTFSLWSSLAKSHGTVYSPPTPKSWKWTIPMPFLSPHFKWVKNSKIMTPDIARTELKIGMGHVNWVEDFIRVGLPWLLAN